MGVDDINIVPKPQQLIRGEGTFRFDANTSLVVGNEDQRKLFGFLRRPVEIAAGLSLKEVTVAPLSNFIQLVNDASMAAEHYRLQVESDRVVITAPDYNGHLYGIQTILQLLPPQIRSRARAVHTTRWEVPVVEIKDGPRFGYRGLMLDVSRHFFPLGYVREVLDEMAFHKLNKFHFHFIDDQGWRLEIKQYPKLTQEGAYRVENFELNWNDQVPPQPGQAPNYGGYYTQDEIRDLLAYASDRGIDVIPEVEMPGHITSASVAYPHLTCFVDGELLLPNGGTRPPFNYNLCPGKETTYQFIEDVLDEVVALFPSELIHVGGDEVSKVHWQKCPDCQKRIKDEGLADEEELESYFMHRAEQMLAKHRRRMVVWKERSESPKGVIPMIYKHIGGVKEPTSLGYDVIVAPASHTYFDFYQGDREQEPLAYGHGIHMPLKRVYQFDPIPEGLSAQQQKHVLGGQANLWAEFVQTENTSEYMLYPRLAALSEAVWTNPELRSWEDFSKRVQVQFNRYAYAGINYARSAFNVDCTVEPFESGDGVTVKLQTEFPNVEIRYAVDGKVTIESPIYEEPLVVDRPVMLRARTFRDGLPVGRLLEREVGSADPDAQGK